MRKEGAEKRGREGERERSEDGREGEREEGEEEGGEEGGGREAGRQKGEGREGGKKGGKGERVVGISQITATVHVHVFLFTCFRLTGMIYTITWPSAVITFTPSTFISRTTGMALVVFCTGGGGGGGGGGIRWKGQEGGREGMEAVMRVV